MLEHLRIYYQNINKVPEETYALIRKDSFGASDVATLFNVGFDTVENLLNIKATPYVTPEELEIGKKPNVRKGKDLEPLILQKYSEKMGEVIKPVHMYEVFPGLTVNFDGISLNKDQEEFPVEAKFVSTFANKYWKRDLENTLIHLPAYDKVNQNLVAHLEDAAKYYGIPVYYYTQIQVQIMASKAKYGDLCALFDKDWEIQVYRVAADPLVHIALRKIIPDYYGQLCVLKGILENMEVEKVNEEFIY